MTIKNILMFVGTVCLCAVFVDLLEYALGIDGLLENLGTKLMIRDTVVIGLFFVCLKAFEYYRKL